MLYGFLESGANMVEMLLGTDGAVGTAGVFGGLFLVLFILVTAGVFVSVPLVVSCAVAGVGGWTLRKLRHCVPERSGLVATVLAALLTITFVLAANRFDGLIPVSRPAERPGTPPAVLACLAGANAALSLFLATRLLRRFTTNPASSGRPT